MEGRDVPGRQHTWRQHFKARWSGYLIALGVIWISASLVTTTVQQVKALALHRQDPTDWIDYESVEYVEELPDSREGNGSLLFESKRTINRAGVTAEWSDILHCEEKAGTGRLSRVSQNETTSNTYTETTEGPEAVTWHYTGWYPKDSGVTCYLASVVRMEFREVRKELYVESPPFHIR